MKVRFYVDIPSNGVQVTGPYPWSLYATTTPSCTRVQGCTRVAFDVDMPPDLVLPPHDVMAPAGVAQVVEVEEA